MRFEDHFSNLAREYARYRPAYPPILSAFLASLAPSPNLAWDCGTGSGQAARGLVRHFATVVASDASGVQLNHAFKQERVRFLLANAQALPIANNQVDLVTVAQAIHWFELKPFYREVKRVLKPKGVIAAWTYHLVHTDPVIDRLLSHFYHEILGPFWSPRMRWVEEGYVSLPFPFDEIDAPELQMEARWRLNELVGFLASWSATRPYQETNGRHPLGEIYAQLKEAWGHPLRTRRVYWPLHIRVGILNT